MGEPLAPFPVLANVPNVEQATSAQILIQRALGEVAERAVDRLEALDAGETQLVRGHAYDGTVFLVQEVDGQGPLAGHGNEEDPYARHPGEEWTGDAAEGRQPEIVGDLSTVFNDREL